MSTEVESSQLDSGLTAAASSSGAVEKSQNKPDGTHLQKEEDKQGQKVSEKQLTEGHNQETGKNMTDMHEKCNETDKENDQSSNADSAVETVKRKVVEAPPPKVNPWTKRTTGRVPINNMNSSAHEKGEIGSKMHALNGRLSQLHDKVTAQHVAPPLSSVAAATEHVVAAFDSFTAGKYISVSAVWLCHILDRSFGGWMGCI